MPLKLEIKEEDFKKLDEATQKLYVAKKDADGVYKLDLDGDIDDPSPALRRGKERVEAENKELKEKLAKVEAEEAEKIKAAEAKALEKARKDGDIDVIEKKHKEDMDALGASWQKKHDDAIAEKDAQISKLTSFADDTLVQSVAETMANEISTVPALMKSQIAGRLTVDHSGETPVTKVLDENGKISAWTTDDLKKSFVDNKDFAAIIKGTNASGGGAQTDGKAGSTGGAGGNSQGNTDNLSKIKPSALRDKIADKANAMGT